MCKQNYQSRPRGTDRNLPSARPFHAEHERERVLNGRRRGKATATPLCLPTTGFHSRDCPSGCWRPSEQAQRSHCERADSRATHEEKQTLQNCVCAGRMQATAWPPGGHSRSELSCALQPGHNPRMTAEDSASEGPRRKRCRGYPEGIVSKCKATLGPKQELRIRCVLCGDGLGQYIFLRQPRQEGCTLPSKEQLAPGHGIEPGHHLGWRAESTSAAQHKGRDTAGERSRRVPSRTLNVQDERGVSSAVRRDAKLSREQGTACASTQGGRHRMGALRGWGHAGALHRIPALSAIEQRAAGRAHRRSGT